MKSFSLLTIFFVLNSHAQSFIADQYIFGGNSNDEPVKIIQAQNKLYMICSAGSFTNTGNLVYEDLGCSLSNTLLICLDENGNSLWQKVYCGNENDFAVDMIDVDNGIVMAIASKSDPLTGNKTTPAYHFPGEQGFKPDYWIVKVDYDGVILWQKTYGSTGSDWPLSLSVNGNNEILITGYSYDDSFGSVPNTSGNKSAVNKGQLDTWVLLLDENGDELWQKTLGVVSPSSVAINSHSGVVLPNGNIFVSSGSSFFGISGDKTVENFGGKNAWLVCLDASGNQLWDKIYGGDNGEDNGKMLVGENYVYYILESSSGVAGNRTTPTKGNTDILIYKMDFDGNIVGQTNFGDAGFTGIYSAYMHENRIILCLNPGSEEPSIDKSEPSRGAKDYWFLSFDTETLELVNEKTYGGPSGDLSKSAVYHNNHLFVIGGSISGVGGDKTVENYDFIDAWVLKLNPTHLLNIENHFLFIESTFYPNPASNQINIAFNEATQLNKAVLYDQSGKAVREQSYAQSFEQVYLFSTAGLASGVYTLSVMGNDFVKTQQVVVE